MSNPTLTRVHCEDCEDPAVNDDYLVVGDYKTLWNALTDHAKNNKHTVAVRFVRTEDGE